MSDRLTDFIKQQTEAKFETGKVTINAVSTRPRSASDPLASRMTPWTEIAPGKHSQTSSATDSPSYHHTKNPVTGLPIRSYAEVERLLSGARESWYGYLFSGREISAEARQAVREHVLPLLEEGVKVAHGTGTKLPTEIFREYTDRLNEMVKILGLR